MPHTLLWLLTACTDKTTPTPTPTPTPPPTPSWEVVSTDAFATELLVDDTHACWTEAHVREYDDRPIAITRAAVRCLPHTGGPVETLFDFERDDRFCTPAGLTPLRDGLGWLCQHEELDSSDRSDGTHYMLSRNKQLHTVAARQLSYGTPRLSTDGRDLLFVDRPRDQDAALHRVDPETAHTTPIATLPPALQDVQQVIGLLGDGLVGISDRKAPIIWLQPLDGTPPRELWRPPAGRELRAFLGDGQLAVVSGGYPHPWMLTVLEADRPPRTLIEQPEPLRGYQVIEGQLYFHAAQQLQRIDLSTGVIAVVGEEPAHRSLAALGGGWMYWREDRTLRRRRISGADL